MKQDIENIIKKNLPEKTPFESKLYQNRNGIDYCGTCEQAWEYCSCPARNTGFNQALSQIPISLIADEVLKVIIRKIEEIETFEPEDDFVDGGDMEYASRRLAVDNSRRWGEIKIKTDILQLLSNLSPNKENKSNSRNY